MNTGTRIKYEYTCCETPTTICTEKLTGYVNVSSNGSLPLDDFANKEY